MLYGYSVTQIYRHDNEQMIHIGLLINKMTVTREMISVCVCVCVCLCVCARVCVHAGIHTEIYTCTTDIHIRTCMGIHYVYVLPRLCASTTTISQIYNTMGPPLSPFPTCLKLNRYILFRIDQPVFYKDE